MMAYAAEHPDKGKAGAIVLIVTDDASYIFDYASGYIFPVDSLYVGGVA